MAKADLPGMKFIARADPAATDPVVFRNFLLVLLNSLLFMIFLKVSSSIN
jgi:hypothetical protein